MQIIQRAIGDMDITLRSLELKNESLLFDRSDRADRSERFYRSEGADFESARL